MVKRQLSGPNFGFKSVAFFLRSHVVHNEPVQFLNSAFEEVDVFSYWTFHSHIAPRYVPSMIHAGVKPHRPLWTWAAKRSLGEFNRSGGQLVYHGVSGGSIERLLWELRP